ncbi:MAG: NUDIX domain-containing protein [Christensenellaceae bacterium]|jgi:8-oxo-dGTP pyrophosphatase MutT (NUDIX family)|nr:NUDIX domain-containing protein [Christensenellaceae bacterium]
MDFEEKRNKTRSASMCCLVRDNNGRTEVLMQQRGQTASHSGMWDCSSAGHVEIGESMTDALVREAKEEIGVELNKDDIVFTNIQHSGDKNPEQVYYNGYFFFKKWTGEPKICEPEKCWQLEWFDINKIPENTVENRKAAIKDYINGITYSEHCWNWRNNEG